MHGLTNFVIIIVINALNHEDKRPTNYFDTTKTLSIATNKILRDETTGNPHSRSNIQKQAYLASQVKTVRQAYGLVGVDWTNYSAYRNNKLITLNDIIRNKDEIIIIKNGLSTREAFLIANEHRILPERTGS